MNILHISDLHFGSRHWTGNDALLLEKLNSYQADLVINTGDCTTDALESEFQSASTFFHAINSAHFISIPGNHDKRNMKSQDFYRQYISDQDIVFPLSPKNCRKKKIFIDPYTTGVDEHFTDINIFKLINIKGKLLLVIGLDTNLLGQDNGCVDKEMLRTLSSKIEETTYDEIILLNHHSIVDTDNDPLFNSRCIIDFVRKYKIKDVFCGHTHTLSLTKTTDLYHSHSFTQYKIGSLSCRNAFSDTNMFTYYENFGEDEMKIHIVRIFNQGSTLSFKTEILNTIS